MERASLTNEELLGEIIELLRIAPSEAELAGTSPEALGWLGRTQAILTEWDSVKGGLACSQAMEWLQPYLGAPSTGYRKILTLLHTARSSLQLAVAGPIGVAVGAGEVFAYFDGVRRAVEEAHQDLFFVDPYLNAEFVSRFLPHARSGVTVRLLTGQVKLQSLLSAVAMFTQQHQMPIEVRTSAALHDRWLFVDRRYGFNSGASFKDGGRNAPTTFTQVKDEFEKHQKIYETSWSQANPEN